MLGQDLKFRRVIAPLGLFDIHVDDRKIQLTGNPFGTSQEGGILMQKVDLVMQVVATRSLVGYEDNDTPFLFFLEADHLKLTR